MCGKSSVPLEILSVFLHSTTRRTIETAPLAITSYHTNKTRLAEAPFGPVGDDNGPVSEPAPHDHLRYV